MDVYLCLSVSKLREHMAVSLKVFCLSVFISFISYFQFWNEMLLYFHSRCVICLCSFKLKKNTYITVTFSVIFTSRLFWCKTLKVFAEQILCLLKAAGTK